MFFFPVFKIFVWHLALFLMELTVVHSVRWWLLLSHHVTCDSSTPWTGARQAPLSMEFSRHKYWSGLPFPSPGDLPNPEIQPTSPALAGGLFTTEPSEKPIVWSRDLFFHHILIAICLSTIFFQKPFFLPLIWNACVSSFRVFTSLFLGSILFVGLDPSRVISILF